MRQLYDQDGNPVYLRPPTPKLGWGEKLALGAVLIMVVVIFATFLGIDPRPWMQQFAPGVVSPPVIIATPRPAISVPQPRPVIQQPAPPAPAQEAAPPAPIVVPADVQYNATQEAVYQEVREQEAQQIREENAAMPVDPVGVKQQPAKSDWCSGAHLDNPECQEQNGSKEVK